MKVFRFSTSWSTSNETRPMGACRLPVRSVRYSILPALASVTARETSMVTVPDFGFGMSPRGPRIRPSGPTWLITSGVAMTTSQSNQPPLILSMYSVPTKSAPASSASLALSPWVSTSTRWVFPVPCGRTTVPRTIWSACRGSTPNLVATSTVSSKPAVADALTASRASRG